MAQVVIDNLVLNSPYDEPQRHFRFAEDGITDGIVEARWPSSYFVPIPAPKKKGRQLAFDTEWTKDRIEDNDFINRVREHVARWLADWAKREESWGHNLIALGDFTIDRAGDANYQAFTSTGLRPPAELDSAPRTIFASGPDSFYDQIARFTESGSVPVLSLACSGRAGFFDFTPVFPSTLTKLELSWRMSDHYPLWVEFNWKRS